MLSVLQQAAQLINGEPCLAERRAKRSRVDDLLLMQCDSHAARFHRVFQLSVATLLARYIPAVSLERAEQLRR
jgi:hypothetical protein